MGQIEGLCVCVCGDELAPAQVLEQRAILCLLGSHVNTKQRLGLRPSRVIFSRRTVGTVTTC